MDTKLILVMIMAQMVNNLNKNKLVENTPARPGNANRPAVPTLNVEVTIPLKYLKIFLR